MSADEKAALRSPGYRTGSLPEVGLQVQVDSTLSLAELTALVNGLCDQVEDRTQPSLAVLNLGTTSPDRRYWPGQGVIQQVSRWEKAVRRLECLDCATVAVMAGICGGPALDLLLATDYRIGARGARLLLPVNEGHFWPGMAVYRLANQAGLGRARQTVLWSHELTLQEAMDFGLVDECVDAVEEAVTSATMLLGRITGPELSMRRRLLLEAPLAGFDEALGAHLAACDRELRRLRSSDSSDAGLTPGASDVR